MGGPSSRSIPTVVPDRGSGLHDGLVNLAQAVAETADKPEWWQSALTPLGYVLAAIIAGSVAIRLARKTPHENLKALVEIRKAMPHDRPNLDEDGVLDAAIRHELDNIATLTAARGRGLSAYAWARVKLAFARTFESPGLTGLAIGAVMLGGWAVGQLFA